MKWRKQYSDDDREAARSRSVVWNEEPSRTMQSFKDDADLNVIVKRFGVDKEPVPPEVFDPRYYGDTSEAPDLRTALERVRAATQRFNELPARLRRRFDNDPAKLWEFVNDAENLEEAVALGVLQRRAAPEEPKVAEPPPGSPPPGTGGSGPSGPA